MNINDIDLNLLRILDAVYSERSVSRAAHRLNLSQPRVSNALLSLRALLEDRLFVRTGRGVAPTERMTALAPRIREALTILEGCLVQRSSFEPRTADRTFRLHMSDSIEIVAVPSLRQRVEGLAPRIRLETTQIPTQRIPQALQAGEIDFAIGSYGALGDDIIREHLFNDPFVLLVAHSHVLPRNPSREALQQARYVVVGESQDLEQLMADLGLTRRVSVRTSFYLSVPALVHGGALAVWLPRSVARAIVGTGKYRIVAPSIQQRALAVNLFRHPRAALDPGLVWMSNLVRASLPCSREAR
ncbi:Nodulation protein D 2 [Paraburkholderia caribensis]|uniref:LysR family transcriptional regulator n=1 Tax=Paraburkholderia caribensis TaxID=75105 RepID=UPI001CAD91C8|nr:LysR family transcriptional regulator [Paraburkholderia caribensis]CAG9219618.1 Nodulation protein D 2 [Paraburkholderia caribensis]